MKTDLERAPYFWSKIASTSTGCWLWGASKSLNGYARFGYDGNTRDAHRYAYRLCVGDIPDGWEIDHKCSVRACVNPDHLQAVPPGWNAIQGGRRRREVELAKPNCARGHAWTAENTMRNSGGRRMCRQCSRVSMRRAEQRYRAKKKAEKSC